MLEPVLPDSVLFEGPKRPADVLFCHSCAFPTT